MVTAILVALIALPLGCGGTDEKSADAYKPGNEWLEDMRERTVDAIEDPGKRAEILAMVDQLEKELITLDRVVQSLYADFDDLNKNYNSVPAHFYAAIAQFETDQKKVRGQIIDTRFKMRDLSTLEEWKKLTDVKKRKGLYKQTIRQPNQ